MAVDKKVRFGNIPNNNKNVKVVKNPDSYKSQYISWQFSLMDFNFEYGWNHVVDRIKFTPKIKEEVENLLIENDCHDDVYNLITNLNTTDFVNIHAFFSRLQSISHISTKDILSILAIIKENFFWNEIFPKLKDIETKKWQELEIEQFGKKGKSKHHWVSVKKMIRPAQQRLMALQLDDVEELFSMRLTATQRIWGIRDYNYFKMIWFDINHEICPSNKD